MSSNREGFTVRILRSGSVVPVGVGFVVDERHIVTCAHVVNSALGRDKRARNRPDSATRVDVDFPLLGDLDAPMRGCRIQAWVPPPEVGFSGGDVAGLQLVGDELPKGAGPARLTERATRRHPMVEVFGYPDTPQRHDQGAWSALHLRGVVGGGLLQIDSDTQSAIRAQPGYSGSPVVVEGEAGDEVVGMLAVASRHEDGRDAYAIPIARLTEEWPDVLGALTVPTCPYRGLESFTVDDAKAGVFVGREEEVVQLRGMVRAQPLVVVTGPSGVGKSSLVNAGLVRVLQDEGWITRVLRPEGMPFEALAETFAILDQPDSRPALADQEKWVNRLHDGGLAALGSRLSRLRGKPILICLDQFEQVLDPGICDPASKGEFLDLLLQTQPTDRLRVVCTLRADFLSQFLEHPDAGVRLRDRLFTMSPMGMDRMERVITEPAEVRGVRYAPGLAKLIARDAGGGGGLPLLGFALTELWPQQRQRQITLADYDSVGGVVGALSTYAERVYNEILEKFTQNHIRRVMLALVRSRGGASEATRRLVPRSQLGHEWAVAVALAERRLMVVDHDAAKDEDSVQIAHEALIREWPRFTGWVDDDADYQHWLTALEERAADGDLLPDTRLAEADRWLAERPDGISEEVKQLIERSKAERDRRLAELDDARRRAQASEMLAEESVLRAQESQRQAQESQRQAEARRLAAAAELAIVSRGDSLQVAIALAILSLRTAAGFEADTAIRHALRLAPLLRGRVDHGGPVNAVAFSPEGSLVVTGGYTPSVFEAFTGVRVCRLFHKYEEGMPRGLWRQRRSSYGPVLEVTHAGVISRLARVDAVAFSPDGSRVATAGDDFTSRVFSASTGQQICRLDHGDDVLAVTFSPDGSKVATGSADHSARVFDAVTGAEMCHLNHDDAVSTVAFSPDGRKVVTGSGDRTTRIFEVTTGTQLHRLEFDVKVVKVAFSPDGVFVVTASGRSVFMSNADDGSPIRSFEHDADVLAAAVSQNGLRIATGSGDGGARVFDAATGGQVCRFDHGGEVVAVAFSPDGAHVTTGSSDGTARVLDARTGREMRRLDHGSQVTTVAVSPDGAHVATGSRNGAALVFDAGLGAEMWRLNHKTKVDVTAFSPDGSRIATGSGSRARVLDADTGVEVLRLDHGDDLVAVAFSPDGTRLSTMSVDGRVQIFNAFTGTLVSRLEHGWKGSIGTFSPDGTRLAVGRWDGSVRVLDIFTREDVWRTSVRFGLKVLALNRNGTRLAACSGTVAQVIDMAAAAPVSYLPGSMTVCAFSPDGELVVTGSDYGSVRVLNVVTGAEECHLDHGAEVGAVAFSRDGAHVATGCADYNARVFNAVTGAEVCRLEHGRRVTSVAFNSDDTLLCTGCDDGSVRVWVVERNRLIEQAAGRLTRDLTQQEWRRFFPGEPYRSTVPGRMAD